MTLPPQPPPHRILVTRLRFIGDVVLTTPVIRSLRQAYPDADITYLTERDPAELLNGHPDLNDVIALDRMRMMALPPVKRLWAHVHFLRRLRSFHFDLAIDLFGNPRSALLTLATGARVRVGYAVRGRGMVYNVKIRRSSSLYVTDAYLDAVRTLEIPVSDPHPRIDCRPEETAWAAAWLCERGLAAYGPIIGLNPGASWPAKMWGAERFARLGDRLIDAFQAAVLLFYGPGQRALAEKVWQAMRHKPHIVDMTPLKRLAALIRQCHVFVSNDCGPMHIAAAAGTPVVGLFGPSRPDIWFPYARDRGHTALKPGVPDCCGRDICAKPAPCITTIPVEAVVEAVDYALSKLIH